MLMRLYAKLGYFSVALAIVLAACTSTLQPGDATTQAEPTPTERPTYEELAALSRHDLLVRTWVVQMAQVEARMTFKSDGTIDQEVTSSPGATQVMSGRWELKTNDTQLFISYGTGEGLTWDIVEMTPELLKLVAAVQPGTAVAQTLTLIPKE